MKIGINLAGIMLKKNITAEINGSGCPVIIVRDILMQLLQDAETALAQAVEAETQEAKSAAEKGSEEENAAEADHTDHP